MALAYLSNSLRLFHQREVLERRDAGYVLKLARDPNKRVILDRDEMREYLRKTKTTIYVESLAIVGTPALVRTYLTSFLTPASINDMIAYAKRVRSTYL